MHYYITVQSFPSLVGIRLVAWENTRNAQVAVSVKRYHDVTTAFAEARDFLKAVERMSPDNLLKGLQP